MRSNLTAGAMRVAMATVLALCVLGSPQGASAQLVQDDDPCYQKLAQYDLDPFLLTYEWSNTLHLAFAQHSLRIFALQSEEFVLAAKGEVAAGKTLGAADLARVKDLNDCLPWLLALSRTIDDELKKRNVNLIAPKSDERNRGRAEAEERAKVAKEITNALDNAIAGLRQVLKPR